MTPTTLTPELGEQVCEQWRKGKPKYAGAAACGVARMTLHDWLKRGKEARAKLAEGYEPKGNDQLYADFIDAFELAWDQGESFLIDEAWRLAQTTSGKWGLPITLLERTRRADWSKHTTVEKSGTLNVSHSFDPSKLSNAELDLLERILEKAAPNTE